jgi:hypothetical protein
MTTHDPDAIRDPGGPGPSGRERPVSGFVCLPFDLNDLTRVRQGLSFLMGTGE